jgi:SAM-dependent methyltransferase
MHHIHTDQWKTRFPGPIASIAAAVETRLVPLIYGSSLFVAISESTARSLQGIGVDRARIRVIEPGVDLPETTFDESPTPLFVALTRLVPHKRVNLLLEAWRQVQPKTGGRFVVIGAGPELAPLRRQAADIPGAELAGWIGEADKQRLLGEAWLLIHGAHHEGWGMAIMEAGAAGTPSLAIHAPGVCDSVIDGTTGIIIETGEEHIPDALSREWAELAVDATRRQELGSAARVRAAEHSWDRTVDAWLEVVEEAVAMSSKRRTRRKNRLRQPPAPVARGRVQIPMTGSVTVPVTDNALGLRRMGALLRSFRNQFDNPDQFYTTLAADTISLIERFESVAGKKVLDVGGGSGYFAEAFRRASAVSAFVEPLWDEMTDIGRGLGYGIVADGCRLPIADSTFDVAFSSNVIEHVRDPWLFLNELVRVVRPGGLVFVAFTNWLSPFGGHETSPWHYLGGDWAAQRYQDKLGYPPKNRYGESLFPLSISKVLKWSRGNPYTELLDAFPRYYPHWTKPIVSIPGVREIVTWNLAFVMRKVNAAPETSYEVSSHEEPSL